MSCKTRLYFGQENGYARVKVDSATSSRVAPILRPESGHILGPESGQFLDPSQAQKCGRNMVPVT